MNSLFVLLFLLSVICLIAGLIKPSWFNKLFKGNSSRKKVGIVFGIATFVFLSLSGATSSKEPQQSAATQPAQKVNQYVFDVPSLIGKNIDEIRTVLGIPVDKDLTEPTALQLEMGTKEWNNTFKKDGVELLVTYRTTDRKVVDFFISQNGKFNSTKDKESLLGQGNLNEKDSKYRIEFVKMLKDPSSFTGVKITPLS